VQLDKRIRPQVKRIEGDYNLALPISSNWDKAKRRIMLIVETIDSEDLAEQALLFNRSRTVFVNVMNKAQEWAAAKFGYSPKGVAFMAVNFNNHKFMDQPMETWPGYRKRFAKRIHVIARQFNPTDVIVFGDYAASTLLPEVSDVPMKRGWVHQAKLGGHTRNVVSTLDIFPMYSARKAELAKKADDDDDDNSDVFSKANLLFYVVRNLANALAQKQLYDLSYIKANPKLITSIAMFDKMMDHLESSEYVAVDTETRNTSVNHNAIHTIQFATSTKVGYVLPYRHPQATGAEPWTGKGDPPYPVWTQEDLKHMRKRMRKFFGQRLGDTKVKYLIIQYSLFDLRILRKEFGLALIFLPVWEIMAGLYCLDENMRFLSSAPYNTPHGGLNQIFLSYGNDHYMRAVFGKDDRANAALTKIDNKDFLAYGAMDVQSIVGIHLMQIKQAGDLEIGGKPYAPYFKRLVLTQFSDTCHVLSHTRQRGMHIDIEYLKYLKGEKSPLLKLMDETKKQILATPEAQRANRTVLKQSANQTMKKGLFSKVPTVLNLGKWEHKAILFLGVLQLKPLMHSKKTQRPMLDKHFLAAYKENPVVALFTRYSKLQKLWGTYVKGWYAKMVKNPDSREDFRLRPDYGFFDVVTGRLNSSNPSLHQVPAHGDEAKYIKRMFVSPRGTIHVKFDYSAHEVRVWSYVGNDTKLANVFRVGQRLRQIFRLNPTEEYAKKIKTDGDVHIINVKFFFNKVVDKSDPLRDAVKKVIFGVIYGKGAQTLARDVKNTVEFAKDLMARLYKAFPKASKWLEWSVNHAREHCYTYSPIGMRRNLFAMLTGIGSIISSMDRKAKNSPIQGLASQIGVTAARLVELALYDVLTEWHYIDNKTKELPTAIMKMVHDALYAEVPYDIVLIYVHVLQWIATYGVTDHYKKVYGFEFTIEPEIEMEFGATEADALKWDFSHPQLEQIITKVVDKQKEIGQLKNDKEVKRALDKIWAPYRNKKLKKYLDTKYPILGVKPGDKVTLDGLQ
jgi:DNA polymerase I-like protein with 3'-5' exonuclease and polymerase domains